MNAFSQTDRIGTLATVLGTDVLVLRRLRGSNGLNALFEYEVHAIATRDDIDFDSLLGTHATASIETQDGLYPFDGIITEVKWLGPAPSGWQYALTLRPWLWITGQRRNQRIFHDMTVVDIVQELWADYAHLGTPHLAIDLIADYRKLEYTVQYRETDLDFARRQLERHGISFHFRHELGNHILVLTDDVNTHDRIGQRPYYGSAQNLATELEHFKEWGPRRRLVTGAIRLTDYNFKKPSQAMETHRLGDAIHAEGQVESYDFPGDYLELNRGKGVASIRTDQERGGDARIYAQSDIMGLSGGRIVSLGGGDDVPGNGEDYLCLKTEFALDTQHYSTAGPNSDDGTTFEARHVLLPVSAPMAPPKVTPRALVHGPQTGVVVGEGEIDCDQYGRILVHLHWDLEKDFTMRCRVSQNWASKGWGGMVIPRIGMEVVVEFLEGDPDKPLVTGSVYNGKNDPPYPLPEHKTKSVFRSDSHVSSGFNEITFEDATGAENISLHAQKDQTLKVLNNRMKRIDNDQVEAIGNNKSIDIGKNHQEKIGGSMNLFVGGGKGFPIAAGVAAITGWGKDQAHADSAQTENSFVQTFMQATKEAGVATEAASLLAEGLFDNAGNHRGVAGAEQIETGTKLGSLLSSVMPIGGIKTTIVEKAVLDTVGMLRTEQVGVFKNTVIGHTQTTTVGKMQRTNVMDKRSVSVGKTENKEIGEAKITSVGDVYQLTVGKSSLAMHKDGTIVLRGVNIEIESENTIKLRSELIDLN